MSLICISTLALNGWSMTIISGVVGGVDSVAKEIKINKLENKYRDKKEKDQSLNLTFHLIKTWTY